MTWPTATAAGSWPLPDHRLGRRVFIGLACGATLAVVLGEAPRAGAAPPIALRNTWGEGLEPKGPLEAEAAGDVRFLLVHHTAGTNDYSQEDVPQILRGIYRFHTGPKGWPDVAYNFFVDRFGGVWEGRAGSIGRPVKGDATGGSQGFAILCCFIGDHSTVAPTGAAVEGMTRLLAWLADTYGIDTQPGAEVTFTSRGSNRWPRGTTVTAATIAGHRDMSRTACPGDAAYGIVTRDLPGLVTAARRRAVPSTLATPPTTQPAAPVATTAAPGVQPDLRSGSTVPVPLTVPGVTPPAAAPTSGTRRSGRDPGLPVASGVSAVMVGAATAAAIAVRRWLDRRADGMR